MSQKGASVQGSKQEVTEHLPAIRTNFYSNGPRVYLAAKALVKWDELVDKPCHPSDIAPNPIIPSA